MPATNHNRGGDESLRLRLEMEILQRPKSPTVSKPRRFLSHARGKCTSISSLGQLWIWLALALSFMVVDWFCLSR